MDKPLIITGASRKVDEDEPGEQLVEGRTVHENGAVTTVYRDSRGVLMINYEIPMPVMRGVVIKSDD